eukprot:g11533.t1
MTSGCSSSPLRRFCSRSEIPWTLVPGKQRTILDSHLQRQNLLPVPLTIEYPITKVLFTFTLYRCAPEPVLVPLTWLLVLSPDWSSPQWYPK